jgi:hypothetical protein
MSLIRLVAWSVLLACGAALGSADSVQAQQKTLKDQLVGAWDSPTTVITRPDGTKFEPFGANPIGMIIFAADGHVAMVVAKPDLPKLASNNRMSGTPEENKALAEGLRALYGTYSVDEAKKTLTYHVLGSSFPNEIGKDETRTILALTADEVRWTNASGAAGGMPVFATWRRVK